MCFDIFVSEDEHSMIHNIIIGVCIVCTMCYAQWFDEGFSVQ